MAIADRQDQATEQEVIAFNTTASVEADFQSLCLGATFHPTEDVHISFDGEPATSGSFFLKADVGFDIPVKFTRVSAIGDSTTGNLYILARR